MFVSAHIRHVNRPRDVVRESSRSHWRSSALLCLFVGMWIAGIPAKAVSATPPDTRPNFLFIHVDDLGWSEVGCNRGGAVLGFADTPHIDQLAAAGMRFTDAYAASPVCAPTRGSIVSGQEPARHGVHDVTPQFTRPWHTVVQPPSNDELPESTVTLAQALKRGGYVSGVVGKYGRIGDPQHHGFKVSRGKVSLSGTKYAADLTRWAAQNDQKRIGTHTLQAAAFIEANRHRPFFCYLNYVAVHEPAFAREALLKKYEARAREQPTKVHPSHAAMLETLDEAVGMLLRALDELKLAESTMVIFSSDNGGMSATYSDRPVATTNAPLRAGKGTLYEGGIRVPLIIRWPGHVAPGSVCRTAVISTDFYPTMLAVAGIDTPHDHVLDGVSLLPLLEQGGTLERNALMFYYPNFHMTTPAAAIRHGHWKLIDYLGQDRTELYNLADDLGEKDDLSSKLPDKAAALRKKLADHLRRLGAKMPRPNPNHDPKKADTWGPRITGDRKWNNIP